MRKFLAIILVICMLCLTACSDRYDYKNNSRIFDSISDLVFLNEFIVEEGIQDKNIKEIICDDSKTLLLDYNGNQIYVFAYDFSSVEDCLAYAKNFSGNNYTHLYNGENIGMYYHKVSLFLGINKNEKLLVFYNDKAYAFSARIPAKEFDEFVELFMNQMPIAVEMSFEW